PDRDRHVGAESEAQVVRLAGTEAGEWRPAERHQHLGGGGREALARPDEERDAVPAPRLDVEPDRRERLHRRVRRDALLLPVTAELPADEVLWAERRDHPEDLHLLVADRLVIRRGRRLHGEEADHLQAAVLADVADRAGLPVEAAAALDAEALRHRDLHALDVVS